MEPIKLSDILSQHLTEFEDTRSDRKQEIYDAMLEFGKLLLERAADNAECAYCGAPDAGGSMSGNNTINRDSITSVINDIKQ